jgi:hypothetical protein
LPIIRVRRRNPSEGDLRSHPLDHIKDRTLGVVVHAYSIWLSSICFLLQAKRTPCNLAELAIAKFVGHWPSQLRHQTSHHSMTRRSRNYYSPNPSGKHLPNPE